LFGFILFVIVVAALHDECEALLRQKKNLREKYEKKIKWCCTPAQRGQRNDVFDCNKQLLGFKHR
jgi:hypothetical protein